MVTYCEDHESTTQDAYSVPTDLEEAWTLGPSQRAQVISEIEHSRKRTNGRYGQCPAIILVNRDWLAHRIEVPIEELLQHGQSERSGKYNQHQANEALFSVGLRTGRPPEDCTNAGKKAGVDND